MKQRTVIGLIAVAVVASFITGHDLVVDGGVLVRSNVIDPSTL